MHDTTTTPQYLSIEQSAQRLAVSDDTIRRMIAAGHLRSFALPNVRKVLVRREDLDAIVKPTPAD